MRSYNTRRFTATETVNTIMNARSAAIMNWSKPLGSQAQQMLWMSKCLLLFVPPCWIVLSVPYRSLYYVPFCVFHYSCTGTTYVLPSTSTVVLMPQARVGFTNQWPPWQSHSVSSTLRSGFLFDFLYFRGFVNHVCSSSVYIILGVCSFVLLYFIWSGLGNLVL